MKYFVPAVVALASVSMALELPKCQQQVDSCRTAKNANEAFCSSQYCSCVAACEAQEDACRVAKNANQAFCSSQRAGCDGHIEGAPSTSAYQSCPSGPTTSVYHHHKTTTPVYHHHTTSTPVYYSSSTPVYQSSSPVYYSSSTPVYSSSTPVYVSSTPVYYSSSTPVYVSSTPIYYNTTTSPCTTSTPIYHNHTTPIYHTSEPVTSKPAVYTTLSVQPGGPPKGLTTVSSVPTQSPYTGAAAALPTGAGIMGLAGGLAAAALML